MNKPELVDFILKDVNSTTLKQYIKDLEYMIENIEQIVNNDKISGIEAKMIVKDLLKDSDRNE